MSIPEWVVIICAGIISGAVGWGVNRLLKADEDIGNALKKIDTTLSVVNGRMIASETWQNAHEKQDDERHHELLRATEKLWELTRI